MIKNLKTGKVYNNRKEAKEDMGHSNYNKAWSNGELQIITYTKSDVII